MATWRVTYRGHWVDVEAQYAAGAFGLARPLLVQASGSTEIAFVDCGFRELPATKAKPDPKFGARA
jgi:hypothetical protein